MLTGCTAGGSGEYAAEQQVVAEFFALLGSGDTSGIADLITDRALPDTAVLEDDFYAAAVARPTDATVASAFEAEPGEVFVTVNYSLGGDDREIQVAVVQSGGTAKIDGWLHSALTIDALGAPGAFEVNESIEVGEVEGSTQFVALPGLYTFEYVDPEGLGTVDPEGAASKSFPVEFPVEPEQLGEVVPSGVEARGSAISTEPRLLAAVATEVETQIGELVEQCSASALVGESCPPDLRARVDPSGTVDTGSIVWRESSTEPSSPSSQWSFSAEYSVFFIYVDLPGTVTADVTFSGRIASDSQGNPVLEPTV